MGLIIAGLRSYFGALAGFFVSGVALAHDGHGNTPWHAVLHMLEDSGAILLLALILMVALLVLRARKQRGTTTTMMQTKIIRSNQARTGGSHDSR